MKRFLLLFGCILAVQLPASNAQAPRPASSSKSPATPQASRERTTVPSTANDGLRLKMISGTAQRRIATINNESFLTGETHRVTVGTNKIVVECVEIREGAVLVRVEGESTPKELKLGEIPKGTFIANGSAVLRNEVSFPEYNCAISIPNQWREIACDQEQSTLRKMYASPDGEAAVVVAVQKTDEDLPPVGDRFAAAFESGYVRGGGKKATSARFTEVGGRQAYERIGEQILNGQRVQVLSQVIPVGGHMYLLQAFCFNRDAAQDPEMKSHLASFRFLDPAKAQGHATSPLTSAYRVGYGLGNLVFLGIIIVIIRAFVRRSSSPSF